MNDMTIFTDTTIRMTSREIAELVGKRLDNVKRTIETLVGSGVIQAPQIEVLEEINGLGLTRKVQVHVFEGQQGKRDSIVVVAQLSPEFTARLVDRWQELEAQAATGRFKVPQTMAEALRLAADLSERVSTLAVQVMDQEERIDELEPKAEFHDEVADATGLMTMGEAANRLQIGRTTLFHILRVRGILKQDGGRYNTPYQAYIDRGYFKVKSHIYKANGQGHVAHTTYVTPKGMTYLFKLLQNW